MGKAKDRLTERLARLTVASQREQDRLRHLRERGTRRRKLSAGMLELARGRHTGTWVQGRLVKLAGSLAGFSPVR